MDEVPEFGRSKRNAHPGRIVSGAGSLLALASLNSPGKRGGAYFSARSRQRAYQDPLMHKGGDALS